MFRCPPAEVLCHVAGYLPGLPDRRTLSMLSRHTHAAVAPLLFRRIRFTNLAADAALIDAVVATMGSYAAHLHFDFFLFPNDDTATTTRDRDRPPSGRDASARRLVHDRLSAPHDELWGNWSEGVNETVGNIYISEVLEGWEETLHAEQRYHWRRAASDAWRALSANGAVRVLDVRSLLPKTASSWHSQEWGPFISRLERLSIGLWGDCIDEWRSNSMEGYQQFVTVKLMNYIFDEARELRALRIVAHERNPIGEGPHSSSVFSLTGWFKPTPRLRELELMNFIVDIGLVEFLMAHRDVLERVRLINCRATRESHSPSLADASTWARFFSNVANSRATALVELCVENERIPLSLQEQEFEGDIFVPPPEEPDKIRRIRQRLQADKSLRLFYYASQDEGSTLADMETIIQSFETGADQAAYNQVQALINLNRRRIHGCNPLL
ncbi:hypothetical protein DFJ73DRAFT_959906 [Zopfochytrium polystomum]|nr:hypothetical protein DFJ73DRAFT_959906 [Zopfochytrium polystomum]